MHEIEITRNQLQETWNNKYGGGTGKGPALRKRFNHFNPDDIYETIVSTLVREGVYWADIGCGRDIFPSNPRLAQVLSHRSAYLFGIDPAPNINENRYLSDRFQGIVEDLETDTKFDIITLRMVVEHIVDPHTVIQKLQDLLKRHGRIVIYTPFKWAPMSLIASIIPCRYQNSLKKLIWDTEEQDTFPTAYKMNTRKQLNYLFDQVSMR